MATQNYSGLLSSCSTTWFGSPTSEVNFPSQGGIIKKTITYKTTDNGSNSQESRRNQRHEEEN